MVVGHFFHRLRSRLGPRTATHPLILTTTVLKFFAAAHLTWMYAFCISPATGPSMMPTFSAVGDWFFISRYHRRGRNIRVGDVVCYRIPVFDDARGLKRVLGMPGDYVMLTTPGVEGSEGRELMIQVPEGHCWLVGDNLEASRDSRLMGPVPLALVDGKAVAKVLPFAEMGWIKNGFDAAERPLR